MEDVGDAMVYLEYLGNSVELPLGETVIGRNPGCALRFNDPSVSREHMRFIRRRDQVFIEDLGSMNGTLVNGVRVAGAMPLRDGDIVRVGERVVKISVNQFSKEETTTQSIRRFSLDNVQAARLRKRSHLATTIPPETADQRCPECGAPVNEQDEQCGKCGYEWDTFRARSVTHQGPNPLVRRQHDRHVMDVRLIYTSTLLEIETTTRDLSESGLFVCSQVLDPPGTSCQLTLLIDGGPPLELQGIVRRVVDHEGDPSEPTGLGIEFIDLDATQLEWIRMAIERTFHTQPFEALDEESE